MWWYRNYEAERLAHLQQALFRWSAPFARCFPVYHVRGISGEEKCRAVCCTVLWSGCTATDCCVVLPTPPENQDFKVSNYCKQQCRHRQYRIDNTYYHAKVHMCVVYPTSKAQVIFRLFSCWSWPYGANWTANHTAELFGPTPKSGQIQCVRMCVFSSHSSWTSSSLDVPAGVTQEEGHTGFLIRLLSAVHAIIFLARRIQPFLSLVEREVEFCVSTI